MQNYTDEFGYDIRGLKAYSGYFKDREKLKKSASGGMATAIAEQFIKSGGVVFGVRYSTDFRNAEFAMVDKIEDLELLKGSKYIDSIKKVLVGNKYVSIYKLVAKKLNNGFRVLFIGLGCDVAAIKKYCEFNKINTEQLFTIDLVCHGPTHPEVARQFLNNLEKRYKSQITDFTVRFKRDGWVPLYLRVVFESGQIYEKLFGATDYGIAFSVYSLSKCYTCKFKGQNHRSDITIGDYWGMEKNEPEYNKDGVSIVFLNDINRGKLLLDTIDNSEFYIQETDTVQALRGNPNYYSCRDKADNYNQFEENLKTKGLHYAAVHSVCLVEKINKLIKRSIFKILPRCIIRSINKRLN